MDVDPKLIASIDSNIERIANNLDIMRTTLEKVAGTIVRHAAAAAMAAERIFTQLGDDPSAFGEKIAEGFRKATGQQ